MGGGELALLLAVIAAFLIIMALILWITLSSSARRGNEGDPCTTSADCVEGGHCADSGRCMIAQSCTTNADCTSGNVCTDRRCTIRIEEPAPSLSDVNLVFCPIASNEEGSRHLSLGITPSGSRWGDTPSSFSYSSARKELALGEGTLMIHEDGSLVIGPAANFALEKLGSGWIVRDQYGNALGRWRDSNLAGFYDPRHYPACHRGWTWHRTVIDIEAPQNSEPFDDTAMLKVIEERTQAMRAASSSV